MSKRGFEQEPLPGFTELVEPIKIVEIGCGISMDGSTNDDRTGRIYDLPYVYHGIEREEEFVHSTRHKSEEEIATARSNAVEAGVIFGNAADLPFEDSSVDVVTMRSIFGQFTGKDYRELENLARRGLMEAFRVLKPGGIIAVSEENTPWEEASVFAYLNNVGFTVIDYSAMQKDWYAPDRVDSRGRAIGGYHNLYAPENEEWFKRLQQFYGDQFGAGFLAAPRQYLMVAQKQQPATVEQTMEWREWTVAEDTFDFRDSTFTPHEKTYKYGQPVEQEHLPGMYRPRREDVEQEPLFWTQPKSPFMF